VPGRHSIALKDLAIAIAIDGISHLSGDRFDQVRWVPDALNHPSKLGAGALRKLLRHRFCSFGYGESYRQAR
jgi:hypothetical protein